jgi:hypothetical protein
MKTALWLQENGTLAYTTFVVDQAESDILEKHNSGDFYPSFVFLGGDIPWPDNKWSHESHRWNGSEIYVDYDLAVEETKARLRREREPLFFALDIQFQRNIETGTDTSAIVLEKNRLRNITSFADTLSLNELQELSCAA